MNKKMNKKECRDDQVCRGRLFLLCAVLGVVAGVVSLGPAADAEVTGSRGSECRSRSAISNLSVTSIRFDLVRKLGQGTYGKVQLGINKETGQEVCTPFLYGNTTFISLSLSLSLYYQIGLKVAIKTIKKAKIETEADLVRIRREIQIMSSVQHPNIIHIYEVFENKEKMVLVMEYAAGGELYDYLSQRKVLSEDEARRIFRQVASAVYYCHKVSLHPQWAPLKRVSLLIFSF